ncbi:MAG: hypothetical protein CVU16_12635 [Betaproteobacteria bacterium HGW-Betaproteobacteria-10]|nr:MAG: hypothetical protein CVU16_12635 [Betaproteobacteria bacterium HGW-Betaproteobacteria-10]
MSNKLPEAALVEMPLCAPDLAPAPIYRSPALPTLPAELNTGLDVIDFEHQMLLNSMASLRQICHDFETREDCRGCTESSRANCEGNLVGLLGDLLAFIMEHFQTEEKLMRDSLLVLVDRDLCEAHMEDHAAISSKVQQIVAALDPMRTPSLIRDLDKLLHSWISNHVALHDLWLARWVLREDSVFKTGLATNR